MTSMTHFKIIMRVKASLHIQNKKKMCNRLANKYEICIHLLILNYNLIISVFHVTDLPKKLNDVI